MRGVPQRGPPSAIAAIDVAYREQLPLDQIGASFLELGNGVPSTTSVFTFRLNVNTSGTSTSASVGGGVLEWQKKFRK